MIRFMIVDRQRSNSVKVHLPDFGLLIESSNGTHPLAVHQMAVQFQQGFGEMFDERMQNLNRRRIDDVNVDVALEDAIKREIENVTRQVVTANHVLFGVESHHRLPFSFAKQIGSSVYSANTGMHRLFVVNRGDRRIRDADIVENGLTNDLIYDIKRKEEAMKTGDVCVHCMHVDSQDRIFLLSEDAAQHLTVEALEQLLQDAESSEALEQEMELHANVARRESDFESEKDIVALVVEIV